MRRRSLLSALGVGLAALAGCQGNPSGDTTTTTTETTTPETTTTTAPGTLTNASFEDGLAGWTVGRDLPEDPNKTTGVVDSEATTTTEMASDGTRSLALSIDGSQDDGTLWVQQPLDLSGVGTVALDYRTVAGGANTITKAAVYAGPERSLAEAEFDVSEPLEREDGGDWQTFEYDVAHDGPGLLAVGITVVWETEVLRLLDDVRLS
jgi:hypothetical protein